MIAKIPVGYLCLLFLFSTLSLHSASASMAASLGAASSSSAQTTPFATGTQVSEGLQKIIANLREDFNKKQMDYKTKTLQQMRDEAFARREKRKKQIADAVNEVEKELTAKFEEFHKTFAENNAQEKEVLKAKLRELGEKKQSALKLRAEREAAAATSSASSSSVSAAPSPATSAEQAPISAPAEPSSSSQSVSFSVPVTVSTPPPSELGTLEQSGTSTPSEHQQVIKRFVESQQGVLLGNTADDLHTSGESDTAIILQTGNMILEARHIVNPASAFLAAAQIYNERLPILVSARGPRVPNNRILATIRFLEKYLNPSESQQINRGTSSEEDLKTAQAFYDSHKQDVINNMLAMAGKLDNSSHQNLTRFMAEALVETYSSDPAYETLSTEALSQVLAQQEKLVAAQVTATAAPAAEAQSAQAVTPAAAIATGHTRKRSHLFGDTPREELNAINPPAMTRALSSDVHSEELEAAMNAASAAQVSSSASSTSSPRTEAVAIEVGQASLPETQVATPFASDATESSSSSSTVTVEPTPAQSMEEDEVEDPAANMDSIRTVHRASSSGAPEPTSAPEEPSAAPARRINSLAITLPSDDKSLLANLAWKLSDAGENSPQIVQRMANWLKQKYVQLNKNNRQAYALAAQIYQETCGGSFAKAIVDVVERDFSKKPLPKVSLQEERAQIVPPLEQEAALKLYTAHKDEINGLVSIALDLSSQEAAHPETVIDMIARALHTTYQADPGHPNLTLKGLTALIKEKYSARVNIAAVGALKSTQENLDRPRADSEEEQYRPRTSDTDKLGRAGSIDIKNLSKWAQFKHAWFAWFSAHPTIRTLGVATIYLAVFVGIPLTAYMVVRKYCPTCYI